MTSFLSTDADECVTKYCSKCCQRLPRDAFNRSSRSHDGLQGYCRECNRAACRKYSIDYRYDDPEWRAAWLERYEQRFTRRKSGKGETHRRAARAERLIVAAEGLTDADREQIQELCNDVALLGRLIGERFALDHIHPLVKRGRHHPDNLQVIPWLMNSRKSAMDHNEALRRVPGYREWTEGPNTFEQTVIVIRLGSRRRLYHLD